mmetsp:Transcript_8574/g.33723  ORF Transcript_8574/g.33723 Transcript_8574/m.33723 type:complete len:200 (+) Transcript_8574:2455-3054(+)
MDEASVSSASASLRSRFRTFASESASLRSSSRAFASDVVPAAASCAPRRSAISSSVALTLALSSSACCVSRPSRLYASDSVSLARTSSDSFVNNRRSYSCVILARTLSRTLGPPGVWDVPAAELPDDGPRARSVMDPRVCEPRKAAEAAGGTGAVAKGFPPELAAIRVVVVVWKPGNPPASAAVSSSSFDASCSRSMPY